MPKRVDANQADIVRALRQIGATVQTLHEVGRGVPDLLVGYDYRDFLLEVKAPDGRLTDDELLWQHKWKGQVAIVRTVDEAMQAIGVRLESNNVR